MVKVALDALGGDFAPDVVIEGAVNAVNKNENLHVVLCGPEAEVKAKLEKLGYAGKGISVVDAPDPVAMDEHPVEVLKKKPHSGLVTCVALQKKGMVDASVSAGNSGANTETIIAPTESANQSVGQRIPNKTAIKTGIEL